MIWNAESVNWGGGVIVTVLVAVLFVSKWMVRHPRNIVMPFALLQSWTSPGFCFVTTTAIGQLWSHLWMKRTSLLARVFQCLTSWFLCQRDQEVCYGNECRLVDWCYESCFVLLCMCTTKTRFSFSFSCWWNVTSADEKWFIWTQTLLTEQLLLKSMIMCVITTFATLTAV